MDNVNKTLYIPLYGKALVSKKNIIIEDKRAEQIWSNEGFKLKGRSRSKWLAYYMSIRAAVYDEWVKACLLENENAIVLHIGCGLDSRIERVRVTGRAWYDIDFPDVIGQRRKYYSESDCYKMLPLDMRGDEWRKHILGGEDAIVILEGVSMYFEPKALCGLLSALAGHFRSVRLLMDCYSERAARLSKYKNPVNDVGVTAVYGYDDPETLAKASGISFVSPRSITPKKYIDELSGAEKFIFSHLYAGRIAAAMYRMYEFEKK